MQGTGLLTKAILQLHVFMVLMTKLNDDDKIKQQLLETQIFAEKEENLWNNIELESENLGSTDKNWKCCCVSIVNGSLNIKYAV